MSRAMAAPPQRDAVDPGSREHTENAAAMQTRVEALRARLEQAARAGPPEAVEAHLRRGKLLARDRVHLLLDPDGPFLELSPLAAQGLYGDEVPGAGLITGIGRVHGRDVVVVANDATVKGGSYYPMTVKKHLRAQEIAAENRLPCVYLVDSGGAYLPLQDQVFPDRDHFGRIFYQQARLSAAGIAQIAVVLGSCTAGGAYVPAMSDEVVIVAGQGTIFLGGPPLVRAATGEVVDAETLGGGEVHCRVSGVADHLAPDDTRALAMARAILADLALPSAESLERQDPVAPRYPPEEIYGIVPRDPRRPYDVHPLIARLVDGSEYREFKPLYGETLVCAFARIEGYRVGILANNGVLYSSSALKATHFIELCDRRGTPLIFIQNIAGFMVGRRYEREGITKHGAQMVHAVACARVPKLTVIIGGSYGAGNYAMCGRAYAPRQLWSWPNARIAVMGGETAARLLASVRRESRARRGQPSDAAKETAYADEIRAQFETQSDPYYATARLWDDGVIDPLETRARLAQGLHAAANAPLAGRRYGVYRM